VSIMASIALLSLAHRLVLTNCRSLGLPLAETNRVLQDVLGLTASEGMIAGQCADLGNESLPVDGASLAAVHHSKTGLLLVAACKTGALLVGATDEELNCLERYARYLGLAYQIQDDLQDAAEDAGGLREQADFGPGKTTYVSFYGASGAAHRLRRVGEGALDALQPLGAGAAKLRHLAGQMIPRAVA
jgi:geranylgeranyl diphosphate synthase type II